MSPFLTATWSHLLNVTYKVPPELLLGRVPKGVELDIQDGFAFASLVAFDFLNTKVKGIKIPFHVNFPEINLRYYIKHKGERGVMFWKELVPKHCIALVAKRVYNEPYEAVPMTSGITQQGEFKLLQHSFSYKGKPGNIEVLFSEETSLPAEDTLTHYFKEHDLGVGVSHSGKPLQYEVSHPKWEIFDLKSFKIDMDFGHVYGEQWAFLADAKPHCACLAVGSEIAVYPNKPLVKEKEG